jgi:hypothetical protein
MAFEHFDYDPLTGLRTAIAWEGDKFHVRYEQDVEPIINHAKALNNEGITDDAWRKNGAALYAVIPAVVQGAMLKKGINFLDQNDIGKVLDEINSNYPWLKTTQKTHAL